MDRAGIAGSVGTMTSKWLGLCVACRKDLYRDPSRHYVSRSHLDRVGALARREARERKRAEAEAVRTSRRAAREAKG